MRDVGRADLGQRRKDRRNLTPHIFVECIQSTRLYSPRVFGESVDKHTERHVPLQFGRCSSEHEVAATVRHVGSFCQKARLADARLSDHLKNRIPAVLKVS